jgi:hypothetical protein
VASDRWRRPMEIAGVWELRRNWPASGLRALQSRSGQTRLIDQLFHQLRQPKAFRGRHLDELHTHPAANLSQPDGGACVHCGI